VRLSLNDTSNQLSQTQAALNELQDKIREAQQKKRENDFHIEENKKSSELKSTLLLENDALQQEFMVTFCLY
jgi:hypothetical protein